MKIYLEDLETEIEEKDCDINKGRIVCFGFNEKNEPTLVYQLFTKKELKMYEIEDIENWFETEYREISEKCTRRIAMGIKMTDGADPKETLDKLYLLAEEKASQIRALEKEIETEE